MYERRPKRRYESYKVGDIGKAADKWTFLEVNVFLIAKSKKNYSERYWYL